MNGKATSAGVEAGIVLLEPSVTRSPYLAIGALTLIALVWGYNWVVMKLGLRYAQPFTFAALRIFWEPSPFSQCY